jgi:hypothetical protein
MRTEALEALKDVLRKAQIVKLDNKGPGTYDVMVDMNGQPAQIKGDDPGIYTVIQQYLNDPYNF